MDRNRVKQIIYGSAFLIIIILILSGVYFLFFTAPASCFDNKKNGNETGLDCGGSCVACEKKYAQEPKISWIKGLPTAEGGTVLVAEIKNQNPNYGAASFSYNLDIFDKSGRKDETISDKSFIYAGESKYLIQLADISYKDYGKSEITFSNYAWVFKDNFPKPQIDVKEFKTEIYNPQTIKIPFYTFTRDLTTGIKGEDVGYLQDFLRGMNFYTASTTGNFDNATKLALINYQKANNLSPANGYFNQITRQLVNSQIEAEKNKVPETGSIYPITVNGIIKNNDITGASKIIISSMLFDNMGLMVGASKTELENMSPTDERAFRVVFSKNIDIKSVNPNLTKVYVDAIR